MKKAFTLLLLALPCIAAAQVTKTANATASISTITALTLTKTTDLAFGSFAPTGSVTAPAPAVWNGNATTGSVAITFPTLPATLTSTSPTGSVAITYGTGAATFCNGTGCSPASTGAVAFNPATGLSSASVTAPGDFGVFLCTSAAAGNTGACSVNLNSAPTPATFTGTITLQVVR